MSDICIIIQEVLPNDDQLMWRSSTFCIRIIQWCTLTLPEPYSMTHVLILHIIWYILHWYTWAMIKCTWIIVPFTQLTFLLLLFLIVFHYSFYRNHSSISLHLLVVVYFCTANSPFHFDNHIFPHKQSSFNKIDLPTSHSLSGITAAIPSSATYHVTLLHNVLGDLSTSIRLWLGPFQVYKIFVPVCGLWFPWLARRICGIVMEGEIYCSPLQKHNIQQN